jgi:hypothetical protein
MRMWRSFACVLLLAMLASPQPQSPAKNQIPESRTLKGYRQLALALEDDYFDGRDSRARVRRHMQTAKAVGAKYFRCAFSWNGIEPQRGHFQWEFWDTLVDEAERHGIALIPYVGYTPEWAARSKDDFWTQPPKDFRWYADVLRAIVRRYKGRVRAWEIWNEPDLAEYWRGTPEEFVELVKAAAPVIREEDPNALVVLGGVSKGPAEFYRALHAAGVEKYVDVVAMHAYPESWDDARAESIYYDRVAELAKLVDESGTGDDLWINEAGYANYREQPSLASKYSTPVYFAYEHTRAYQAEFLFKSMTMALGAGKASLMGWYRVDDFRHSDKRMPNDLVHYHLGLIDVNGRRKPAFYAYRNFTHIFSSPVKTVPTRAVSSAGARSTAMHEVFEDSTQRMVVVAWLRSLEAYEAKAFTGMSRDPRRETLSISMPCTSTTNLRVVTATGRPVRHQNVRFERAALTGIRLTGDEVFVAQFHCERD